MNSDFDSPSSPTIANLRRVIVVALVFCSTFISLTPQAIIAKVPTAGDTPAQPVAAAAPDTAKPAVPATTTRQKAFLFSAPVGRLPYLLYLPKDYGVDPNKRWPLLVFLHGSTEAGKNAEIMKRQALPKFLEGQDDYPFVVLSPQAPSAGGWGYSTRAFAALLDDIEAHYQIDPDRISLTGWSMGGYGVWWMAKAMPDRFAALVPVAGGYIYNAKQLCPLSKIPTWVFHGKKDRNVQFIQSQVVVKALQQCGGEPIFTQYDDAEHYVAMDRAYHDPKLIEWLLAQTRAHPTD